MKLLDMAVSMKWCQAVINAGETRTKIIKTCRNTFNRNRNKVWLGSYWKVITPENYKEL